MSRRIKFQFGTGLKRIFQEEHFRFCFFCEDRYASRKAESLIGFI